MNGKETKSFNDIQGIINSINCVPLKEKNVKLALKSRRDSRMWVTYEVYECRNVTVNGQRKVETRQVFEGRAGEVKGYVQGILDGCRISNIG